MNHPRPSAAEIREHVASIEAVPRDILPNGPARDALTELARVGHAEAYASGGEETGTWCIWSDALAQISADRNGRVTISDWRQRYLALMSLITACAPDGGAA